MALWPSRFIDAFSLHMNVLPAVIVLHAGLTCYCASYYRPIVHVLVMQIIG
jgi:hypothetical protein